MGTVLAPGIGLDLLECPAAPLLLVAADSRTLLGAAFLRASIFAEHRTLSTHVVPMEAASSLAKDYSGHNMRLSVLQRFFEAAKLENGCVTTLNTVSGSDPLLPTSKQNQKTPKPKPGSKAWQLARKQQTAKPIQPLSCPGLTPAEEILHRLVDSWVAQRGGEVDHGHFYVVAAMRADTSTWRHELHHAFYYLHPEYRELVGVVWRSLAHPLRQLVIAYFTSCDYTSRVYEDEFQAHLCCQDQMVFDMTLLDDARARLQQALGPHGRWPVLVCFPTLMKIASDQLKGASMG